MNKMRQWSMLTAVAVLVVLAAGWFLAVSPQRHHASDLRAQTASQQAANSTLSSEVARLQQQKKGLPAQQRLLARIGTQIPDNPALPTLIRQLTTAATAAGVDLVSMSPSAPTPVSTTAAAAPATTAAAGASPLNQISLNLNVKGSYFNLESWFSAVEKLSRAMMVTQWSIAPATGSGTAAATTGTTSGSTATTAQDPPGTMTATLTALVFDSPRVSPTTVSPAVVAPAPAN